MQTIDEELQNLHHEMDFRWSALQLGASKTKYQTRDTHRARLVQRPCQSDEIKIQLFGVGVDISETLTACADSASCINAMSYELATRLGIPLQAQDESANRFFPLPNGKLLESCGSLRGACSLITMEDDVEGPFEIDFMVFMKLVDSRIILGDEFLIDAGVLERPDMYLRPEEQRPPQP